MRFTLKRGLRRIAAIEPSRSKTGHGLQGFLIGIPLNAVNVAYHGQKWKGW
jgi:hypothetical protein